MSKKIETGEQIKIDYKVDYSKVIDHIKKLDSDARLNKIAKVILRQEYHIKHRPDLNSELKKQFLSAIECTKSFYAMASSLFDKFKNDEFKADTHKDRVMDLMLHGQWTIQHLQALENELPPATYQVKGRVECAHGVDRELIIYAKENGGCEILFFDSIIDFS